jgi:hypothetical protein
MCVNGYPDGGSLRISGCCDLHYKSGTQSCWNTETHIIADTKLLEDLNKDTKITILSDLNPSKVCTLLKFKYN